MRDRPPDQLRDTIPFDSVSGEQLHIVTFKGPIENYYYIKDMDIFDFVLDDSDMAVLRGLNIHDRGTRDYNDPAYARKIVSQVF